MTSAPRSLQRRLSWCTGFASLLSVAVGACGLVGWMFGVPLLKSVLPGLVTIKANTSLCFVLIGMALWLRKEPRAAAWAKNTARVLAVVVAVVGGLTLWECLTGWNAGIDQILFEESAKEAVGSVRPGLMSPITAANFLLLGMALAMLDWFTPRRRTWPSQLLGSVAAILSVFALLDLVFANHGFHTGIALQTAVTFCILSFALLCVRPERGLGRLLISPDSRTNMLCGLLARRTDESCTRRWPFRYGLSVVTVAIAALLSYLLRKHFGVTPPFVLYYPAVILAAIFGGSIPGILATLLSASCAAYFMMQSLRPSESLSLPEMIALALFVVVGSSISLLIGAVEWARKRAEEDLRTASRYSRSLIEASLDPLVTISREGKITDVNQATERGTGVAREQLIGSDFSDYFTEPDMARKGYQQVFDQGFVRDYPLSIRHTSGRVTDVLYNATLFKDEAGQIEGIFAAARDITERKRAEQQLQLNQERLALALKAGKSGTFDWEIINNVNIWSPEVEAIYGLAPGEFGGTYEDWESLVVPEDLPSARAAIQQSLKTGEFASEWRIRRRDNEEVRWIDARAKVLLDQDGRPSRMIGINVDITERKRAEESLARQAEDLARSNAELQQFAYVASHDLQEPLRMVASFTQLLARRYKGRLGADADEFIGFAVDGARRMQGLVNDLLAYSRVGTRGREFAPVDGERVLQVALANLQTALEEAGGQVTHDLLPTIQGDETQLCQVLQNLVGNALKFHGSEPPRVHVSAQQIQGEWRFSVRDNGIGIDPEHSNRIFLLFQRLHTRADYPGTGMGLAIAKKIIERHGGRIWVESRTGKGSTFYFTLPMKVVTHEHKLQPSTSY
jgi:two-component system, chemotaxis family, sensor kinase Cph1